MIFLLPIGLVILSKKSNILFAVSVSIFISPPLSFKFLEDLLLLTNILDKTVNDIMTRDPIVVSQESLAEQAISLLNTHKITSLFVVKNHPHKSEKNLPRHPIGIVHILDLIKAGL